MHTIEYRVRPVTRYIVTRFEDKNGATGCCATQAEYDNFNMAYEVGYALARAEHERLGWPLGDERLRYPAGTPHPTEAHAIGEATFPLAAAANEVGA